MGQGNTHSSKFGGQAARYDESPRGRSTSGGLKRPTRDENEARYHFSQASGSDDTGWEKVFLNVARALAALPAA
jgi:hypothetical protein